MNDEQFQKDLRSPYSKLREPALDKLETLAKLATGQPAQGDRQAAADSDMQPGSVNEYDFTPDGGRQWTEENREELGEIKQELHKAGVASGVANAIFQHDGRAYFEVDDASWRSRIETAAARINAKDGGPEIIKAAEAFLNSGLSPVLLEAAAIAAGSELGIRELARLGRSLGRKAAH